MALAKILLPKLPISKFHRCYCYSPFSSLVSAGVGQLLVPGFKTGSNVQKRILSTGNNNACPQLPASSIVEDDTLFEVIKGKGIITLNRPRVLNVLTLNMVRKIYQQLKEWELSSSSVNFVIIKGFGGKAFCAGGDLKAITDSARKGTSLYKDFFKEQNMLNYLIGNLNIPYIALMDGITMGGGVGLSVHGRFRVATEKTMFAMPETVIGLFPDVGCSYFLPRLGGKLGLYLALSGFRLKGGDAFHSGVATHMCSSSMLADLGEELLSLDSSKLKDIDEVLKNFHDRSQDAIGKFTLEDKMPEINEAFGADTIEGIVENLKSSGSEWGLKTAESFSSMSPTSMKITLKLLQLGSKLEFKDCLRFEYRLSQRCCENHDFIEGVRALLIDKDQNPNWKPNTLDGVTPEIVERYFSPLSPERELNL